MANTPSPKTIAEQARDKWHLQRVEIVKYVSLVQLIRVFASKMRSKWQKSF